MPLPLFALLDRTFAPVPDPRRVDWLAGCTFAHRGLHGPGKAENSPDAFVAAVERGYGIELDVQRSMDGQPMVFHDWELERMTAGTGPFAGRSAAQLGGIALKGGGGNIPSLTKVLELVGGRVPLLVEVKTRRETRVPPMCLAVRRALEGYRGPHAVIGFDPRVLRWFARYSPMTVRGLSFTEDSNRSLPGRIKRRLAMWHARPHFLTHDIRELPNRFTEDQRRRGLKLVSWTIADPESRERGLEWSDALICEGDGFP
ncbi:MAG: glycerophosphodiester phosphodiesterase family protein [Novosphingobium sp.]